MAKVESHRDLIVWQRAMTLVKEVYRLARLLPSAEQYRLTNQLLRAAVSIPSNIAEGHSRGTRKDYANFVSIARGSLAETETLLQIIVDVGLLEPSAITPAAAPCSETSKMLSALLIRLRDQPP